MNKVKKMLGVLLTAMLCFALTPVTAFAKDNTLTITDPADGHIYSVYQMLKGDVSKNLKDGAATVSNAEAGKNLDTGKISVADFLNLVKDKREAELGDTVNQYVTGSPIATLPDNGKFSVSLPDGYYLIADTTQDATDAMSRFMVQVSGPTTVKPKADSPTLDKRITGDNVLDAAGTANTAAIGDSVKYELKATLGDMTGYKAYQIVFQDTLSTGLTFNEDVVVKHNGNAVDSSNYAVGKADGMTFTVTVSDVLTLGAKQGDVFTVEYSATVNADAVTGNEANPNTANLKYSNNPSSTSNGRPGDVNGITPDKTVKTYVTELAITKTDENGNPLTGVEFTLQGNSINQISMSKGEVFVESANGTFYALTNGAYTETEPTDSTKDQYVSTEVKYEKKSQTTVTATEENGTKTVKGFVDENGLVTFKGLNAGKYTLVETVTPDGYNTILPIEFEIKGVFENDTLKWVFVGADGNTMTPDAQGNVKISDTATFNTNNNVFSTTIVNKPGTALPSTGGIGTTIFYIVGGVLVVGAIAFLIVRRRMNSAK